MIIDDFRLIPRCNLPVDHMIGHIRTEPRLRRAINEEVSPSAVQLEVRIASIIGRIEAGCKEEANG